MSKEHEHDFRYPKDQFGAAVNFVCEEGNQLWVGNGEYMSQVNYCPVCGYKAKEQVKE